MDSMATLGIPAIGYGIRYEFGIFDQRIQNGWQVERADRWLRLGNPWEIARPEIAFAVGTGGHVEHCFDDEGRFHARWKPERRILGTPFDTPVPGWGTGNTTMLRLWSATTEETFDFQQFNQGDYYGAVLGQVASENVTKVLYPNDEAPQGKRLRLEQQHFFTSCALQDMIRIHLQRASSLDDLNEKWAVQLNDTHPAIAIAELMRLLVDEHDMEWDPAWAITTRTFAYTNHTLLPEALETWPRSLFAQVLPRHMELVEEIDRRWRGELRTHYPGDDGRVARRAIVDERDGGRVRMAHLATVGGYHVNGVAALHSELLRKTVLRDFAELWPERFSNVTNGVTPRRFVALANPRLTALITDAIGDGWLGDTERLRDLEKHGDDAAFRKAWRDVKTANKAALSRWLGGADLAIDETALLDVQVKRIHEYKRQHLNLLHAAHLLNRLRDGDGSMVPRTILIGGKAAPGYWMAKLVIRAAHGLAAAIAAEPAARGRLRLVFVPGFSVKIGQRIYPAADLSEQISTAGMEASGTGNMKFALNGALTIGTLDGANVEIRECVGDAHFFLFGLTAPQVADIKVRGWNPRDTLSEDPEMAGALETLARCAEPGALDPLVHALGEWDPFLVLADWRDYVRAQGEVEAHWQGTEGWTRSSILNVARCGTFSSDRAIAEYARDIWRVEAVPVPVHGSVKE
jgi:starch phosphorylase